MNDTSLRYLCEIAALLPNRAEVPASLKESEFGRALDGIRETYCRTHASMPDEIELRVPFWKIQKHRREKFHVVLDQAYSSFLKKETRVLKARANAERAAIGMGEYDITPEIQEADRRLEAVTKHPPYDGQHRDIVRLALKARRPVPVRVVAEYVDEPWAVEELIARTKRLGISMFEPIPVSRWRPEEHPLVRTQLSLTRGNNLELVGVYVEDTWCTTFLGTESLRIVGIFRTPIEAEMYKLKHRLPRPDSKVFRIRNLVLCIKEGFLTVACAGEARRLPETDDVLGQLESLLASN